MLIFPVKRKFDNLKLLYLLDTDINWGGTMDFSGITAYLKTVLTSENNLFAIATKGGVLMIVLLIISIIAIAIIINRLVKFKRSKLNKEDFLQEVSGYIAKNQNERAIQFCEEYPESPHAKLIALAIEHYDVGISKRQEILDAALNKEIHQFERKLGGLSTFAAIAPLIGFLGTVTGMVKVFMKLGETGGGVDISLLANGIWEALITTIGGLTVGIICILFYNLLVGRVEEIIQDVKETTSDFLLNFRRIKYGNKTS